MVFLWLCGKNGVASITLSTRAWRNVEMGNYCKRIIKKKE
jgi:hypothetical protein